MYSKEWIFYIGVLKMAKLPRANNGQAQVGNNANFS
jgi:hypothetical protein